MSGPTNSAASPKLNCLLCGSSALGVVWSLTGRDVRALWRACGRNISEAAFGLLTPEREVTQFECGGCGFRFFDPSLAGSGKFYEELELANYYVRDRPEFDFALKLCQDEGAKSVLDVGGGEGAFLDKARRLGMKTFALELNAQAAEICACKGHQTISKLLEEVSAAEFDGGVDVLTLFQVIEHVPNPREFLKHAARLVKKGGLIVVAVPNNRGVHVLLPLDPANMPPHHVSRWRKSDLDRLGSAGGLGTVTCDGDILYGRGMEEFWLMHNRLASAIGRRPHWGGNWLPKTISFLYRKLGARYYFPRRGLSIYSAYRKP
jgi:SAM-dependent methyltransferase